MEAAVELAILVAVLVPVLRLATCRPFLRRLGSMPEQAVIGAIGLSGYAIAVAATTLLAPDLLRPAAAFAIVLIAAALWRSRPNFGQSRGLPPGSLRLLPTGAWTDQDYFARDAKRFGPIFKTSTLVSPTICVVGMPAALELFAEHDQLLALPTNRFSQFIPRGFIRSMKEDDHATYGSMLRTAISGKVTKSAETDLRSISHGVLDEGANRPSVNVRSLVKPAVLMSFYRLFLGILPADARATRLDALYPVLDPTNAWRHLPRRIHRAVDEIVELVDSEPLPEDCFLSVVRRAHPEAATDPTLTRNLVYLLQTSGSDVSALLAWTIWMLGSNRHWADEARTVAGATTHLARRIVQETLRMEQSEYIMRKATRTFSWRGVVIPRGARVRVCVWESHRDPLLFDSPGEFNPDRWLNAPAHPHGYSPFGAATSRSRCLGEGLTLTLASLMVEELVTGFDLRVTQDGPPEYSGVHWRPSTKFHIALSARQPAAVGASSAPEAVGGLIPVGQ